MPIALLEHQHELLTETGDMSLVFGTSDTGYLTTQFPVISGGDETINDVARVREDGMSLGEDYNGGKTVAFEMTVLTDKSLNPVQAASDKLNIFEAAWRRPKLRNSSGNYAILRSKVGGRTRRCYGRPRRYDEPGGNLIVKGVTPIVADFFVPDGTWYDDELQSQSVRIIQSTISGLEAPLVTPLTTTTDPTANGAMRIEGSKATWPIFTFHGPIANPKLRLSNNYVVGLNTTLLAGQSITVDTRPWQRKVLQNNGANKAGSLTYESPTMQRMALEPGLYDLNFAGTDLTGTAYVNVQWRAAHPRW